MKKKRYNRDTKQNINNKTANNPNQHKPPKGLTTDSFSNVLARLGYNTPNLLEGTEYPITRLTKDYQLMNSLYRSHWIVRKIIDTIPEDMCKNWINVTSQLEPDQLRKLEKLQRTTRVKAKILEGLKWGRLYGGAGALIMIEGHEDILDQPLNYDDIMPGSFKGLFVTDRWSGIIPNTELVEDINDSEFGLPRSYDVTTENGELLTVHHSRIIRFTGRYLPYWEKLAETYWGASEVEVVFDELKKRDNTSWNIAQLIFLANLRVLKMGDMAEMMATGNEKTQQRFYETLQAQNFLMSNMGMYILNKDDDFATHQYTFSGLNDIYESFMLDVAGACEIPVTRLFGRAPAGMNATGESDLQNYYDTIEIKQESVLTPILDKLLPILCMSEFGAIPDDIDYNYNPVRTPSDDEVADLVEKKSNSIINVFNAGLISQKTALKELRQMSDGTGMFTNITDDEIENADGYAIPDTEEPLEENDYLNGLFSTDADPDNLKIEIESEEMAINTYKLEIERSIKQGDFIAVAKFKEILKDEEDHLRILNELKKKRGW